MDDKTEFTVVSYSVAPISFILLRDIHPANSLCIIANKGIKTRPAHILIVVLLQCTFNKTKLSDKSTVKCDRQCNYPVTTVHPCHRLVKRIYRHAEHIPLCYLLS